MSEHDEREWKLGAGALAALHQGEWGDRPLADPKEVVVVIPKSRLVSVEQERDELKRINEFDIGVANAELRTDLERAEAELEKARDLLKRAYEVIRAALAVEGEQDG
jgi:alpha-D-ribose 1-methylphosphonate 5-triphosphate synthase subunit PhnL